MTHRFRIEVTGEAFANANPGSQLGLVNPVPPTMTLSAWFEPHRDVVVYEGTHHGAHDDIAALDRIMRVASR